MNDTIGFSFEMFQKFLLSKGCMRKTFRSLCLNKVDKVDIYGNSHKKFGVKKLSAMKLGRVSFFANKRENPGKIMG